MQQQAAPATSASASTDEPRLYLIPTDKVGDLWKLVEPFVKRACERNDGFLTVEDQADEALSGSKQLWVVWQNGDCRAAILTKIVRGTCLVSALGGDGMKDWLGLAHDVIEPWARENGCRYLRIYGRHGWLRALEPYGWKRKMVVMTKELG